MSNLFKVAVVQAESLPQNSIASAEKAADLIKEAATKGAKIIVFPEAFLGGYPKGNSFGCPIGHRKPEGRDAFLDYYKQSITLDGPEIDILKTVACDYNVIVVIGCIERDQGTLYCTALTFEMDKGLVAKHRKLMPTGGERLIWGFGDGSTLPVVKTEYGNIGSVICWENYMPMLRMYMYSQGITIYCAPTADDRDSWLSTMQHIALEGRCFVLTSCQFLTRSAYPDNFECHFGNDPETVLLRGGSAIISPTGQILAGPEYGNEVILYAEVDLNQVIRSKLDFDATSHYSRSDIFQLKVDTEEKSAVSTKTQGDK